MAGPKKGPRPGKDPKPIFQGLVIATAGSMGETWTDVNLSRWISLRKGSFVHQMDASVTHLVCTQEEAKTKTPKGEYFQELSTHFITERLIKDISKQSEKRSNGAAKIVSWSLRTG